MGRSSRILAFACLIAAVPALTPAAMAQGNHVMVRMPTNIGARIAMRAAAPAIRPWALTRPQVLRDPRRLAPFAQRSGLGLYGVGFGQSIASVLASPQGGGGYGPAAEPPSLQSVALPPCVRPQIIKIGLGIRRAPPTRLIYGPPTGCVP